MIRDGDVHILKMCLVQKETLNSEQVYLMK